MQKNWGGTKMTIAVFNFANDSLDIIHVDKVYIEDMYDGDVENYLVSEFPYESTNICFMSGFKTIEVIDNDRLNQVD